MPVRPPTTDQILAIATDLGMHLTREDAAAFQHVLKDMALSYDRLDDYVEPKLPVKYPRMLGYQPTPEEDPLNAWYWKSTVKGAATGPLAGRTLALKDNTCLAGVPMMFGSRMLEGFIPDIDATVATRILDAGGTILGKAACVDFCYEGNGQDAPRGGRNPWKPTHGAGGSSSGSAALVASNQVDMSLGCDQAGSIRIPASWCGVYGLKPTHGLVPYTGIIGNDMTLDTVGPMANSVEDVALLLGAIAGPDGYDPRQINCRVGDYLSALDRGVRGMKIGLLKEGFGHQRGQTGASEPVVDQKVMEAATIFSKLGAEVREVSVPMHRDALSFWLGVGIEGSTHSLLRGNTVNSNWQGFYNTTLADRYAASRQACPDGFPDAVKLAIFMGEHMQRQYHGHYYAKAQNLRRLLRGDYDRALETFDLLLLPTTPMRSQPIPPRNQTLEEYFFQGWQMLGNTCATSLTGHPAINVPCAVADGLPIGMMLVGRMWDDATVLRGARAFETAGDWKKA
jgi:amidase